MVYATKPVNTRELRHFLAERAWFYRSAIIECPRSEDVPAWAHVLSELRKVIAHVRGIPTHVPFVDRDRMAEECSRLLASHGIQIAPENIRVL